jgi:hypothetical protein
MFSWLTNWESRRILKLRLKLWWHFKPFWFDCPYLVHLVFRQKSAPWPNYWAWVWVLKGHPPCEIGPMAQWSWNDALKLAGDQYRQSLSQTSPGEDLLETIRPPGVPGIASPVGHASGGEGEGNGRQPGQPGEHSPDAGAYRAERGAPAGSVESRPLHQMQFSLLVDSNYRVQCTCGWLGKPSPKGHMCLPANCADCGKLMTEWEGHVKEALSGAR